MIIYKITNTNDNNFYIGKTIGTLDARWGGHLNKTFNRSSMTHFHCAVRKYGQEAFSREVIATANSESELDQLEYILVRDLKPHYNSKEGGTGGRQSIEVCKKISDTLKGRPSPNRGRKLPRVSDATRLKLSIAHKGKKRLKPFTEEQRARMSASKMGMTRSKEVCENLSLKLTGKKKSKTHCEAISKSRIGIEPWCKGLNKQQQLEYRKNNGLLK